MPGFIRPFTSTHTNLGQKVLLGTDGIFWNIFLGFAARGDTNQTQIMFSKHGFDRATAAISGQVCFGELNFSLAYFSYPTCVAGPDCNYINCPYPAEALSKAAIHGLPFPFMPARWHGTLTRPGTEFGHISLSRPKCFK